MALLACPRYYWQPDSPAQKSVDESAKTEQIIQRADERMILWCVGNNFKVCPFRRNQRLTSIRQNKNKLQASRHARLPEYLQRLPLKWMVWTSYGHPFR
jgi:hypothetical protein